MILASYSMRGKDTANQVYDTLRGLEKDKKIDIRTAAVLNRKDNGKIRLNHKGLVTFGKGVVGGGAIGLVTAALLSGPVGAVTLGGAIVGGLIGLTRSGDRKELKKICDDKLGQDQSALAILVNHADWAAVLDATESYGGEDIQIELTPGTEQTLSDLMSDDEVAEQVAEEVEVVEDK